MAAPTIVAGVRQLLAAHLPFARMEAADLDFLIERVELVYFASGDIVLAPGPATAPYCYIMKQGRVEGRLGGKAGETAFEAGVGDFFPVGALLADRPVGLTYVAVGDTFCLRLTREHFDSLAARSATFLDFCRRRLGALLDASREQLQASYATEASNQRSMGTALGELARRPALTCGPQEPLRRVFERMNVRSAGSMIVVETGEHEERVVGILTRTDLIGRVILPEVPLATAIGSVMTRDVLTLDSDATAADASLLMARHAVRHVPVIERRDGAARVIGVVSERDLFALQRLSVRELNHAIQHAADAGALVAVAEDIRRISYHLVAQGVAAEQMTRLISHLNDRLTQRLLDLEAARLGVPAQGWCWLALGSEGRSEQTIATDQDNGLMLGAGLDRDVFLQFADAVNRALTRAGFPLCKGDIMARNPQWCRTLPSWSQLFAGWIEHGDPQSLLNGSIFFDFRGLHGDLTLATALRDDVMARAHHSVRFLKQMADNALRNRAPASGWFDGLFGSDISIDLKMHGTVPIVDAARIWALAAGVAETGTVPRLRRLAELRRLPEEDVGGWIDAFEFLQLLRLRRQHRGWQERHDEESPNRIRTSELSALDQRILREAFRQARKAQQRLELDFPG
jgi:CBS domain-containing protein